MSGLYTVFYLIYLSEFIGPVYTANLDNESSAAIMNIFKGLHQDGQTIIMVTHEELYAQMAEKIIKIDDGKIISIHKNS